MSLTPALETLSVPVTVTTIQVETKKPTPPNTKIIDQIFINLEADGAKINQINLDDKYLTIAKQLFKELAHHDIEILNDANLILSMVTDPETFATQYAKYLKRLENRVTEALSKIRNQAVTSETTGQVQEKNIINQLDSTFLASMITTHLQKMLADSAKDNQVFKLVINNLKQ